jgi:magnesium chelatase family protein
MTLHEALETTKIHSVVGNTKNAGLLYQRPFRSPHHTISNVVGYNVVVNYKYIN